MPVVAAEDLHHTVTASQCARNADRIHGGLRARVNEAPTWQLPSRGKVFSHDVGVFRWGGEVRPEPHTALYRFGDDRIRVPLHHAADPVVHIEVLVAIHIPDVLALTTLKVDGIRRASLVAG